MKLKIYKRKNKKGDYFYYGVITIIDGVSYIIKDLRVQDYVFFSTLNDNNIECIVIE